MEDDFRLPESSSYMNSRKEDVRKKFVECLEDFKKLLADKTHPDNQTNAYHSNVKSVLTRMLSSADSLDKIFPGEGIFGLIAMNFRSNLKLKDQIILMEVRIRELENEVRKSKSLERPKQPQPKTK